RNGETVADPSIFIENDFKATALINGGNGLGQVIAAKAMRIAINKAADYGISWVGVNASNHFGRNAYFAEMALKHDMIGTVLTVSNLNTMAPWGGLDLLLGNNPIAFAIPAKNEYPIIFDSAFSVAAKAKIIMAAQNDTPAIPDGWALDASGLPTTNPQKALAGILMPIGGYKGVGMSLIISILAGILNKAAFGNKVSDTNVGHAFCAINISAFCDVEEFKKDVDSAIWQLKTARPIANNETIRIPGEQEYILETERIRNGIPLHINTVDSLYKLATELGIDFTLNS
ncbi:MAG: Ldh family oxidoreductase, partial [Patescibacteria group bacterium]